MRKRNGAFSLKRGYVLAALVLIVIVPVFALSYRVIHEWEFSRNPVTVTAQPRETLADDSAQEERPMIYFDNGWYALREDLETVLIMGIDKYEEELDDRAVYRNNQQTDFLMLLVMDPKRESCLAIHLNRDTMCKIPILSVDGRIAGYVDGQLTLAHTYGSGGEDSCRNSVRAASDFLYGMDIHHYIALTMDAVAKLNDAVGGVTVTLEDDFSFVDPEMAPGNTVTLWGDEALRFVRARGEMEDSSNLSRMRRQQTYLKALYEALRVKAAAEDGFLMETLLEISEYLSSDCTVQHLDEIAENVKLYEFTGIENTPGEAVKGETYMEFYADDSALSELLVRVFYEPVEPDSEF